MRLFYKLVFILSIKFTRSVQSASPPLILTPFIEENKINDARKLATVDPALFLNVTSYSGFLTVDKAYSSNMFFWYFPVPDKPLEKTPWIIWLQGGPGTTSLVGVFDVVGPFEYKKGTGLKMREYSWCREYSMVFIDNPVGTGFSHTRQVNGFATNMDMYSSQLYSAVQQLVLLFPELRSSELYVAGESYAGHYIPAFANKAIKEVAESADGKAPFNLKGLIMSNPVLDRVGLSDFTTMFYNMGLLDRQGVIAVTPLQNQFTQAVRDGNSSAAAELHTQLFDKVQVISSSVFENYDHLKDFMEYVALEDVRAALHVGTTKIVFSNMWVHAALYDDFLTLMSPVMNKVLEHYKVLIFCGQLDFSTSCAAAAERRRIVWRWSDRQQFLRAPRTPWWHNESHAGFVKSGGGFTEVLVLDAGHFPPIDKAEQVLQLVSYFIRGLDLPTPPNYQVEPENTPEYTVPDNQYVDLDLAGSDFRTGLIVSVFLNVVFVVVFLSLAYFYWKRGGEFSHTPLFGGTL